MKKKILYLECASGISGDMTVASLLDLGADRDKLDRVLTSLQLEGFTYQVTRGLSHGMEGCDFDVILAPEGHHHPHHVEASTHDHSHGDHEHEHFHGDHEHEHSHGDHEHEHTHDHQHDHQHEHQHEHSHDGAEHAHAHVHAHEPHQHEHRNLASVYEVIDRGVMSDKARALAKKIFLIVAEAEAKAHGKPIDEVHFHEVGAIDSIVDIVAAAVCVDDLGIDECVVTGLSEGTGLVRCQHGDLPVPVPAVSEIAARYGIPLRIGNAKGEMVTPTGIAIVAALRTQTSLPEQFVIEKIGKGLGKRDFGFPNLLRSMIIRVEVDEGRVWVIESNIDDATGEQLGFAMEEILLAGAKDVHYVPCFMKKSRPAYLLRIIVSEDKLPQVEDAVFRNTTTIGLRKFPVQRTCLKRESVSVDLPCGTVEVKKCSWDGSVFYYPEYESVKTVSKASGVDFKTVFDQAKAGAAR